MSEISLKVIFVIAIFLIFLIAGILTIGRHLVLGKPIFGENVQTIKILEAQNDRVLMQNTGNAAINSSSLFVYVDNIKSACKSWSTEIINPGESSICTLFLLCNNMVRIYAPDNYDTRECR